MLGARMRRATLWSTALSGGGVAFLVHWAAAVSGEPVDLGELVPEPSGPEVRIEWIHEPDARMTPMTLLEHRQAEQQRELVDAAANRHLGQSLSGDRSDLRILQRLVDEKVFGPEDTFELQALGVVRADLLVQHHGYHWVAYRDEEGRTRALREPVTEQVIFPVTANPRRVEVGLDVDVESIYEKLVPKYQRTGVP